MRTISISYPSRAHLLTAYAREANLGGIFVPGAGDVQPGQLVQLEMEIEREERTLRTPAIVRWRRTRADRSLEIGLGIEFVPPNESEAEPLSHGPTGLFRELRRGIRYPVELLVDYNVLGFTMHKTLSDISRTGAFINTDVPPSVGMIFPVQVMSPDASPIELSVASVRKPRHGEQGVGVEFLPSAPDYQQRVSWLMAHTAIAHLEAGMS